MKTNKETKIENKKVRELTDEEAKQVAGSASFVVSDDMPIIAGKTPDEPVVVLSASDGSCSHTVSLDNGKCTSKTTVVFALSNPCDNCKYRP